MRGDEHHYYSGPAGPALNNAAPDFSIMPPICDRIMDGAIHKKVISSTGVKWQVIKRINWA